MTGTLAILGGCGGIGRDLVDRARADGYNVLVLDLATSIDSHPLVDIETIEVDARSPASLAAAAAKLPDNLAGFVNLCGFTSASETILAHDAAIWNEVIDGNLNAAFHAAQAFAPLVRKGGSIVNIGSGLGYYARPGFGPYAVSKAAIAALTRQMASELAPNVRVNCVAPAAVNTAFLRGGTGRSNENEPERLDIQAYARTIPLGRIGAPSDVSGPILFLVSDAAAYMTGQVLHVNGGAYMP